MRNISRVIVIVLALGALGGVGGSLGHLVDDRLVTACVDDAFACQ